MSIQPSKKSYASYRSRRSVRLESDTLRVSVTLEGAHVAEITDKATGVMPLWTPPWPSIEPSLYDVASHPEYGDSAESRLLSGLMGHNICLDTYGGPSSEEAAAGMPIHGEGPTVQYHEVGTESSISLKGKLPLANVDFERRIHLAANGSVICFSESVSNLSAFDRPIAWTQHVTLGPPFLVKGETQFRASATRSKVIDSDFGGEQQAGAEFLWPLCPKKGGGAIDLRVFPDVARSGGFTTHMVDPTCEHAFFVAWSPSAKIAFGYAWKRMDFPWMCRWEENHRRTIAPWNGKTLTCAVEFGVSPTLESRREMVQRGSLWGVPAYKWLPAKMHVRANYCAFIMAAESAPESAVWDGNESVRLL
jgi:hypothetical protein